MRLANSLAVAVIAAAAFSVSSRSALAQVAECHALAASTFDKPHPAGVAGVAPDQIDSAKAVPACRKALAENPSDARLKYQLARSLIAAKGKPAEAAKLYREAADAGFPLAMNELSGLYMTGEGVQKNEAEANAWLRKAADRGLALAQYVLAKRLIEGTGAEKKDAFERLFEGTGAEKNATEAVALLKKASDSGYVPAMMFLGKELEDGDVGVDMDEKAANEWYRKAAEAGDAVAMRYLATNFSNGIGVAKSEAESASWYRKAAEAGDADAMREYGLLLENGKGVPKDEKAANEWYRKAADAGDAAAMRWLAVNLEKGKGTAKDIEEADRWLHKAAKKGSAVFGENMSVAQRELVERERKVEGEKKDEADRREEARLAPTCDPLKNRVLSILDSAGITPGPFNQAMSTLREIEKQLPTSCPKNIQIFSGSIVNIVPCYNKAIYVELADGGKYVWSEKTRTFNYSQPQAKGEMLMGLTDVPYYCIKELAPLDVWPGMHIGAMARSKWDEGDRDLLVADRVRAPDREIAELDRTIMSDPKDAAALEARGGAYYKKKDYDRAIADYDEAIRLDPKLASAFNNRGNAYTAKGDPDRAIRDYNEATRLDPGWLGVHVQNVDDTIAKSLHLGQLRGALIAGTDDKGPAKAAGLKAGDVIVKFDGIDIKESRDLPKIVASAPAGKDVEIVVMRQGKQITKTIKLGRLEDN